MELIIIQLAYKILDFMHDWLIAPFLRDRENYSDPCQTSRVECFQKVFILIFEESSTLEIWQNSKYGLGSIYVKILNIQLLLWILNKFYIWQASKYSRILNIPEFWICYRYIGFQVCLNMSDSKNARICVNISFVWMILFTYGALFLLVESCTLDLCSTVNEQRVSLFVGNAIK